METHVVREERTPALIVPRHLRGALYADEELALEVKQLIEVGKQQVQCVLRDGVALCECLGVFLYGNNSDLVLASEKRASCTLSIRACMTSKSWTYLRSVSTSSRMMLLRAVSFPVAGMDDVVATAEGSDDGIAGEDADGSTNTSGGSSDTMWFTRSTTCAG